jgi:queuine tRNA-ribosyltransferase
VEAVARGVDTFDCVMPTRVARNGGALTMAGRLNLRNAAYARDSGPIDASCGCAACAGFSRGALRHWLKAGEILPLQLLTLHNLHFMLDLARRARTAIVGGTFPAWHRAFRADYTGAAIGEAGQPA